MTQNNTTQDEWTERALLAADLTKFFFTWVLPHRAADLARGSVETALRAGRTI